MILVSSSILPDGGINTTGDISRVRLSHSGALERSRFATLDEGLLGLTVDRRGFLYAAVTSFDPATHGVWRINPSGAAQRLAGSNATFFPNALTGEETWADGQIRRVAPGRMGVDDPM